MQGPKIGYALLTEQTTVNESIIYAVLAEDAGFDYMTLSDHFHPWIDKQGHSPFVWELIGALSQVTERMIIGTAVTCPTIRYHPAIIAQAAATASVLLEGRFFLGVGSGENLNEHIVGAGWPDTETRLFMLAEAIQIIRTLWKGGIQSYKGTFYDLENAMIYDLPEILPKIIMAASGPKAANTAGLAADGLMSTSPNDKLISEFKNNNENTNDFYGQIIVCYDEDEEQAIEIAHDLWPLAAMPGVLNTELALPKYFEDVAELITPEHVSKKIVCGPDTERHVNAIKEFSDKGFNHIQIAQVGPNQEGFISFYKNNVIPKLRT